jgi:hypothetical protein
MQYLKLDSQGRTVAGELESTRGYVGQFAGNAPFTVNPGIAGLITHLRSNIVQHDVVEVVSLFPAFALRPRVRGYYYVHHQRTDYIYAPSLMNYTVTLSPVGNTSNGIDSEIFDTSAVITGSEHDLCKTSLGYNIYCNGTSDIIQLQLSHTNSSAKEFGNISAQNSTCWTSVFYAGENLIHGVIP